MRALVVSDLHSNADALRAVMQRMRRKKYDRVICLGDFVGYGAQPNQVLDVMRTMRARKLYIRGNHDRVAAGVDEGVGFNNVAKHAALWTRDHLSAPNRNFLKNLPLGPIVDNGVVLCHGSPHDEDEYVFNESHAAQVFTLQGGNVILYGHTHLPAVFSADRSWVKTSWNSRRRWSGRPRALPVVGRVGPLHQGRPQQAFETRAAGSVAGGSRRG